MRTGWNDKGKRIKIERVAYGWRVAIILRIFSIYKLIGSFSKSRSIDRKNRGRKKGKVWTSCVRSNERECKISSFIGNIYLRCFFPFFHDVKKQARYILLEDGRSNYFIYLVNLANFYTAKKMKRATKKMQIYKGIDYRTNTRVVRFSRERFSRV